MEEILRITNLKLNFRTEDGLVKALDGVDLVLNRGEILGVVGETGCGKSVTAHAILRLLPSPPAEIVDGEIRFRGKNLLELDEDEMNRVRGSGIAMIFQEPMTSLNPAFTIGEQMIDVISFRRNVDRKSAGEIALESLKDVRMPYPKSVLKKYPHELSGGQRQRVMIALALSCKPEILIADEPTTALDVTIQVQILKLIKDLQKSHSMSVILITHDMGIIAQMADRVVVMYAGTVVESGPVREVLKNPLHPYTKGLLRSIPKLRNGVKRLETIPGSVPNLLNPPSGCRFHPRCDLASGVCVESKPKARILNDGRTVACHAIGEGDPS